MCHSMAMAMPAPARAKKAYPAVPGRFGGGGVRGGEEFAIILPNTDLAETMVLAERLREQVVAFDVSFGPHTIRRTVSIGVASYNVGEAKTTEAFLKEADHALYAVKKGLAQWGCSLSREGMTISSP